MKIFFRIIVILIGIILIWVALIFGASELTGEVVTLLRPEQDGTTKKIRLWVVDINGKTWVEHGTEDSFWIKQLTNKPEISLIRNGVQKRYLATPDFNSHAIYHELREEKYGVGDRIIEITSLGSSGRETCKGVPVRLMSLQ
tara:strand:- start:910 stop:1335 length:426 start_codon:yes stop_codon:yes gene_type:complete